MNTSLKIFIDTEFTTLSSPELLSLAAVTEDGRELYLEIDLDTPIGKMRRADSAAFVHDLVIPQFGAALAETVEPLELGDRLAAWLIALDARQIDVVHDHAADFELMDTALGQSSTWRESSTQLAPTLVADLCEHAAATLASEESWSRSAAVDGLDRHHALADARALRAAFEAVEPSQADLFAHALASHHEIDPGVFQPGAAELAWFRSTNTRMDQLARDADDDAGAIPGTPVIFLDIDDVICLYDPFGGLDAVGAVRQQRDDALLVYQHLFHAPAVAALREVHDHLEGHVRYVVSSTWRHYFNRSQFAEVLRQAGLRFVADRLESKTCWATPNLPGKERVDEIDAWLSVHGHGVPFAVIDDTFSGHSLVHPASDKLARFKDRVVICGERIGLTRDHVARMCSALGRRQD